MGADESFTGESFTGESFTDDELEGSVFERWPRVGGLLRPGMYHDHARDVMWICLSTTPDLYVAEVWLAGDENSIVCLVDEAGVLIGLGFARATLILPPAAFVPGALPSLPLLWNPESDVLQIRFFDGPVLDDVKVWELRPTPDDERVLRFVWEPGHVLAAVVAHPASTLVHPSVLVGAAGDTAG